ncbi:MAG: tRNA-specific adenosine deaminase [Firmicutes bacterium]|nr:tRNA-specific adenosine deaminase [Bacillota bacterium]
MELSKYMRVAIEEAKHSLCEGNNGFGAVIIKDQKIIAKAHDQEDTHNDPTSHAELNAIRSATRKIGKKLTECILVSTHEPCPMCATAAVWAGISEIVFGYSINEAVKQGRKRIGITCEEIFKRSHVDVKIHDQILHHDCEVLYRKDVRAEIKKLRNADAQILCDWNADSIRRRVEWFKNNKDTLDFIHNGQDILIAGYKLLLTRFRISPADAPIIKRTDKQIVFHSRNFCPTLEACKILGLDTRRICKKLNENATDMLLKQIDTRLCFSRNYEKLRPYSEYCEEMISINNNR